MITFAINHFFGIHEVLEILVISHAVIRSQETPKAHITAGETGEIASKLQAKNLIISHVSEEVDIERSVQLDQIKTDAGTFFDGSIYTPLDGDIIILGNNNDA